MSGLELASGDLEIERLVDGARVVLALRGELDLASAPALDRELDDALRAVQRLFEMTGLIDVFTFDGG